MFRSGQTLAADDPDGGTMTEPRRRSWAEPFKLKMVEPLKMTTREEREAAIPKRGTTRSCAAILPHIDQDLYPA